MTGSIGLPPNSPADNRAVPSEQNDWFQEHHREQALRDAFIYTYADADTDQQFYAVDTLDTTHCPECNEDVEMVEEVEVSFMGEPGGLLRAEIARLRDPRLFCRECLTAVELG